VCATGKALGALGQGNLSDPLLTVGAMIIDCDTCLARDISCGDCVINVLLTSPPLESTLTDLDPVEFAALGSLAQVGLVPPLRLLPKRTA
jgi:hypothetical protein